MKKAYIKPMLLAESLDASEGLASSCEGIAQQAVLECSVFVPDLNWFLYTTSIPACVDTPQAGRDPLCYHAPTDENNVFSS